MKSGIPYFPLDVQMDTSMELLEAEFGIKGFAIIVKLYQLIYGENGYYSEWNDEVGLLFARKNGVGCDLVSNVIKSACKRGIFDGELFSNFSILTSRGIQERYLKAVARRQEVEMNSQYLLISCDLLPKNVSISGENVDISDKNVDISKQSKVKKSKVKKSKVKETTGGSCCNFPSAIHEYEKVKGAPLTEHEITRIPDLVEYYGEQWTIDAINIMGDKGKCSISYVDGILRNWKSNGKNQSAKENKQIFSEEAEAWFQSKGVSDGF